MIRVFVLAALLLAGCGVPLRAPLHAAQLHGGYVLTCNDESHALTVTRISPGRVVAICEAAR